MLRKLLKDFLGRYRRPLLAVVALTFVQTMATLLLPTLNADIIDKGVVPGDTDYIWRTGGIMLVVRGRAVAVLLGRPYAFGFGLAGEAGVRHVLRCVLAELELTLALSGVTRSAELGPELLVSA